MRKLAYLLLAAFVVAAQVVIPLPTGATASAQAEINGQVVAQVIHRAAIEEVKTPQPNFDTEIVAPLRARQEAAAQAAKAAAIRRATPKVVFGGTTDAAFTALRQCEAGGNYAANTGNGYYGAYQYNLGTWANYGGYARPDLAPPAVQDAKAQATQAARGWSPWPACARKLGLL